MKLNVNVETEPAVSKAVQIIVGLCTFLPRTTCSESPRPFASHVTSQKSLDQSEPFETREINANEVNITTWSGNQNNHSQTRSNYVKILNNERWHQEDVQAIRRIFCWWIRHNRRRQKELEGHLTKRQKEIFVQYGFSKALLGEVIGAGWDQVDINNYVLYYNSQVETTLAVRSPGLDMSMKQTINAIIRTKLQAQEQEEEEMVSSRQLPRRDRLPESPLNQIRECYPQDHGK